jgi:transcriptional regulator with XRE-family HTH domain
MSQVDLAVKSGLYQRTISEIERGLSKHPNLRTLQALALALDVPLSELLLSAEMADGAADAAKLAATLEGDDPTVAAIVAELRDLDDDARKLVLEQARAVRKWQADVERQLKE